MQCRCSKATKLQYLRCDPKAPPLADGERCRPYSGDWESAMLWGWEEPEEPKNVVWLIISMIIQYISYISMIFNDSCPVSGGYLTDTWCCHNFLGWTLEVIAMFQKRWESSGGVKRCETTKMWGLTTNLNGSIILHQWDLSHHCFIRFHPEKTQEELHFTPRPLKLVLGHLDKRIRAKRS